MALVSPAQSWVTRFYPPNGKVQSFCVVPCVSLIDRCKRTIHGWQGEGSEGHGRANHQHAPRAVQQPYSRPQDPWRVGPRKVANRHVQVRIWKDFIVELIV